MSINEFHLNYSATGAQRKKLVEAISTYTHAEAHYEGVPTFAYTVDYFTIDRNGTVSFDDRADSEEIEGLIETLDSMGFHCEEAEQHHDAEEGTSEAEDDGEPAGLTISLPLDGLDDGALERLTRLLNSKAKLIQKALNAQRVTFLTTEDTICFPWWDEVPGCDEGMAAAAFIAAIVKMAREHTRVTATEKDVQSEKYAFRSFLLRLGFIGEGSKAFRKALLKNLSGSAAFPNAAAAAAFSAAQKAKRDAAKSNATAPTEANTASEEAMA